MSGGPSKPSSPAAGSRGAASGTPREGRPTERGQRLTPPPPDLTSPCLTEVAPQPEGTDAPGPAACSPTAPAPPPILPAAPQRPPTRAREWEGAAWAAGATGVGAALLALPGSRRLGCVPLTFGEASPGPRALHPARAGKLRPGTGDRGGAERPAARGSAQQRPLARLLAGEVSLAPSLARSVSASVGPWGPPSPAAAAAAAATAAPAPARQRVPPRLAVPLAGSRAPSLAPFPRRCRRRAERSPAGHGLPSEVPLAKGEAVGARRGRGGKESPGEAARLRPPLPNDPRRPSGSRPQGRACELGAGSGETRHRLVRLPGEWRTPRVCLEVAECADSGVSACAGEGGPGGERGKGPSWVSLIDCPRGTSTCLRPSPGTW
ncbi:Triple Functional Domain Protein [Manis pentadactyla]|nr:Triple Functional Domain Protein [Manis pentadactyla]